jgi:trehalose/maltose hydrolase-like predicted phosphorylase
LQIAVSPHRLSRKTFSSSWSINRNNSSCDVRISNLLDFRITNQGYRVRLLRKNHTSTSAKAANQLPLLTRSVDIQLNMRVWLQCQAETIWSAQGHCLYERSCSAWRLFIFEEKMKSGRRRRIQKAKTPNDLAAQFREWQELRIKVSKAELAIAQRATADDETKVEGNGRSPRKPTGRGRTH